MPKNNKTKSKIDKSKAKKKKSVNKDLNASVNDFVNFSISDFIDDNILALYDIYKPYIYRYSNLKESQKTKEDKVNEEKWKEELKHSTFYELIEKYRDDADKWLEEHNKKRVYVHKNVNALTIDNNELINSIVLKENNKVATYNVKGGYLQIDLSAYEDINYTEVFAIKNIITHIKENRFTTDTVASILYNPNYNEAYTEDKQHRVKISDKDRLKVNKYIYYGLTNNFIVHDSKRNLNTNGYFLRLIFNGDIDLKNSKECIEFEKPSNVYAEYKQYYLDNLPIDKENKEKPLLLQYNEDIAHTKNSKVKGEMARKLENSINICKSMGRDCYYLDVKEIYNIYEATSRKNKLDAINSTINIITNNKDYKPLKSFNIVGVEKVKGGTKGATKQLKITFK